MSEPGWKQGFLAGWQDTHEAALAVLGAVEDVGQQQAVLDALGMTADVWEQLKDDLRFTVQEPEAVLGLPVREAPRQQGLFGEKERGCGDR